MYQALYRKYRPRRFCDVAGQEHVTETLRRQIIGDRLSHAYLFVGTRGTGKTSCAKILSRAVNCLSPVDGEPCNNCFSCIGIENGSILDVLELDAASNNGVDNVRALREEAIYSPASVKKRVYIVDEVHMLSNAAFNALLKILEEPPEHLVFILATTELHKVPATILSRCQRFSFKRLSSSTIAERLSLIAKSEGLTLTAEAEEKLAALADGSMRDGISLLDQCASDTIIDLQRVLDTIGLAGQQELLRLAGVIADGNIAEALGILDTLYQDGRDMASLLNELATLMRDILVYKLSPDSPLLSGGFSRKELLVLSKKLTPERLFSLIDIIRESFSGLSRGGSAKLSVEMCLIRMSDVRLSGDASGMLARIARLEVNSESRMMNSEFGIWNSELTNDDSRSKSDDSSNSESRMKNSEFVRDKSEESKPNVSSNSELESKVADKLGNKTVNENNSEFRIPNYELESGVFDELGNKTVDKNNSEFRIPNSEFDKVPNSEFWTDILKQLEGDMAVYMLLSDSANVQAELRESSLIIRASSPFTVNTIESKMFSVPLKEAAKKVLGREVVLRVETGGSSNEEAKREKLERLSAFDIIQFE